jgi:hypothetical protein
LLMSDQGLIIGGSGSGHREFRFGVRRPRCLDDALTALGNERCLQGFDIVRKRIKTRIHAPTESEIVTADS